MKINLICIGDELLIGQVVNTNASWLGQFLSAHGLGVRQVITVGDRHTDITSALHLAYQSSDLVITTGGLGPTKDDISKKAIADYFEKELVFHNETWERIVDLFNARKIPISEQHKAQCLMPEGAEVLQNHMGTAPGLWIESHGKYCVMLPGVPYEMQHLMQQHVLSLLQQKIEAEAYFAHTFNTVGVGETVIADHIAKFEDSLPAHSGIAYLPGTGQVRIRLSQRGGKIIEFQKNKLQLEGLIQNWIFGENDDTLESVVGQLLMKNSLNLVLAESCTGGYLSHRITSIPGSSAYFKGGVTPYSNELKIKLLGVSEDTLMKYGAVSEQVVIEMVKGALEELQGDIAVSISGIAGPDGGTEEKPVGTVWIAVGNKQQIRTLSFLYMKDRERNIQYTAIQALNMIRKFLIAVYFK